MKTALAVALLAVLSFGGARGAPAEEPPSAAALLAETLARLPRQPLDVKGKLVVRRRHGQEERTLSFDVALRWGDQPPTARYTIRDAFGRPLEQLVVERADPAPPRLTYAAGNPLAPAPLPDLFAPIQQTDLSWTDLTLSFLWWQEGAIVATNEVRGRRCYLAEMAAPAAAQEPAAAAYARVRLWIDCEIRMLLQAEGLGADGYARRRLWVKSFKRVDETWMIKDIEVQQVGSGHRTKLMVLETNGAPL